MAHWGVAMTYFHPLWGPMNDAALESGREALARAHEAGVGSDRERVLLAATDALMEEGEISWWDRLDAWHEQMERAYAEHEDDEDVASLYALSQLAAGQTAEDRGAVNERAANVLLAVHERKPTHPGAIHYTIHANDVSGRADKSQDVVRNYNQIAPDVPHALHMPTHIYVRTGDWPEVIDWNRRSADAALDYPAGDRESLHWVHALDYLAYAYLQQAADDAAESVLDEMNEGRQIQEDFATAYHVAAIPARYAVERRDWSAAAELQPRTPDYVDWDASPWAEALTWFARGLGAVGTDDMEGATAAEARMAELRDRAEAAGQQDHATYIEIDRLILEGIIAHAQDDGDEAVRLIREAADLESSIQKHPVTPGSILPPNEALGQVLLSLDRPEDALAAYQHSLEVWPARYHSLLGAARAADAAARPAEAERYYRELLETVDRESSARPGVQEAVSAVEGAES